MPGQEWQVPTAVTWDTVGIEWGEPTAHNSGSGLWALKIVELGPADLGLLMSC